MNGKSKQTKNNGKIRGLSEIREQCDQLLREVNGRHVQRQKAVAATRPQSTKEVVRVNCASVSNQRTGETVGRSESLGISKGGRTELLKGSLSGDARGSIKPQKASAVLNLPVVYQKNETFTPTTTPLPRKFITQMNKVSNEVGVSSGMKIEGPMDRHPMSMHHQTDGGVRCIASDFLTTVRVHVNQDIGSLLYSLPLAPLFHQGGRLNSLNQLYTKFKINNWIAEFIPMVPSTIAGAIGMEISKDPNEPTTTFPLGEGGLREFMARDGSVMFQVFSYGRISLGFNKDVMFSINGGDVRMDCAGVFNIFSCSDFSQFFTDGESFVGALGDIIVHYDVTFFDQTITLASAPKQFYSSVGYPTNGTPIALTGSYGPNGAMLLSPPQFGQVDSQLNFVYNDLLFICLLGGNQTGGLRGVGINNGGTFYPGIPVITSEGERVTLNDGNIIYIRVLQSTPANATPVYFFFTSLQAAISQDYGQIVRYPAADSIGATGGTVLVMFYDIRGYVIENGNAVVN